VVLLQIGLVSAWRGWWGGYCWGSRLLAEVVPLLALLCLPALAVLWRRAWGCRLVVAAGVLSFLLHLPAVHYQADEWNIDRKIDSNPARLWSWGDAPFFYLRKS
jgi:hypothetical protein